MGIIHKGRSTQLWLDWTNLNERYSDIVRVGAMQHRRWQLLLKRRRRFSRKDLLALTPTQRCRLVIREITQSVWLCFMLISLLCLYIQSRSLLICYFLLVVKALIKGTLHIKAHCSIFYLLPVPGIQEELLKTKCKQQDSDLEVSWDPLPQTQLTAFIQGYILYWSDNNNVVSNTSTGIFNWF